VDNPALQPKRTIPMILIVGVLALMVLLSLGAIYVYHGHDPYVETVLSLTGDRKRGHEIFEVNCAACHGVQANGDVGPSLQHISQRKSKVKLIYQVISGKTPPMPKFQPNSQDMADLLSYLENI
jgi:mono/diheme cytochrome c family protein